MRRKGKKAGLRPRHIFLCCAVCLLFICGIAVSQATKIEEISQQQEALDAEYNALLLEEQRIERMLAYTQTDEYLRQYIQEKFGYIDERDYKFYIED